MKVYERFIQYAKINTVSNENSITTPSDEREFDLARLLVDEMNEIGINDVYLDDNCYVYGVIPATAGMEAKPALAFIAHIDTAPDYSGENVDPQIIENYDGCDIHLNKLGTVIKVSDFPHLTGLAGRTLITANGDTLLGADDKAGIAEIMTAAERIISDKIPHGKICIAFTPDEEIGSGAEDLNLERLGADYGYTMDGGAENEIEYENFNASSAVVTVNGINVHPGSAKNIMVNAAIVAMEYNSMLPEAEVPAKTEGYEGFIHLTDISGNVEKTVIKYIIRDHDSDKFSIKEKKMESIATILNEKYGEGTVEISIKESYRNMKEKVEECMFLIENAKKAMESAGVVPDVIPIRGGTDGARLSFRGLVCPNLGTGGYAFHGPMEHISVEGMETATDIIVNLMTM